MGDAGLGGARVPERGRGVWGPPQPVVIRTVRLADYPRIVEIAFEHAAIEGQLSDGRNLPRAEWRRHSDAILQANLGRLRDAYRAGAFVAEDSVKALVVGYVLVRVERDMLSGLEGWVQDVAVTREYRGMGIAQRLLEAAEAYAREQGATVLAIRIPVWNTPALRLCEKAGFKEEYRQLVKPLR